MAEGNGKCPFHSGANTSVGSRSNKDWWPNQLNLKILHQTMAQRGEAEGLSNDWLDFNEAVSMIVEQEGALLNSHKMAIKQQKMILAEEEPLLASVMVRCLRTWPSSVVGASVHPLAVASPQTSLSTTSTGMWPSWTSCCVRRSGCVAS